MTSFGQCKQMLDKSVQDTGKIITRYRALGDEAGRLSVMMASDAGFSATGGFAETVTRYMLPKSNQALVKANMARANFKSSYRDTLFAYDIGFFINEHEKEGATWEPGAPMKFAQHPGMVEARYQETERMWKDFEDTRKLPSKSFEESLIERQFTEEQRSWAKGYYDKMDVSAKEFASTAKGILSPWRIALAVTALGMAVSAIAPILTYKLRSDLSVPSNVTAMGQTIGALSP